MIPVELRILAFWDLVVLTVGMESNTWNERVVSFVLTTLYGVVCLQLRVVSFVFFH